MKKEELLKSISDLLKKHEDFLNENPEVFYAIEDRFFKAIGGDDDYEEVSYEDMMEQEPTLYDDEVDYGQGYGDDLFDPVPSEGDGGQQDLNQEQDEADKWLAENDPGQQAGGTERDNTNVDEAGTVQQEVQEAPQPQEQEQATPVETAQPKAQQPKKASPYDWKPKESYHPEAQGKIQQFMNDGYSHREAERMAGAHDAPATFYDALNRRTNPSEPSPKMLEEMKGVAKKWLSDARKNTEYDPKKNPVLSASGKSLAAHEDIHGGFAEAYKNFLDSEDLKGLSRKERRQAIRDFKNNWNEENPDHRDKAISAADSGAAYSEAAEARKKELMDGLAAIMGAGQMHVDDSAQGYSQEVAGLGGGQMTDQAAAQMVGSKQGDEGGYQANIKKDPAMIFAEKNPEVVKQLKEKLMGKLDPNQMSRMSAIDSLKPKQPEQPKADKPKVKTLDDKGLQHINDHLIEYAPLINMKGSKLGRNLPDHIDDGDLLLAGMHGLVDAFHTYDASKGASFKSHASRRIEGKMRDYISGGGPNAVDKYFYDAARKMMGNNPAVSQPADSTAGAAAAPQEIKPKKPEGVE